MRGALLEQRTGQRPAALDLRRGGPAAAPEAAGGALALGARLGERQPRGAKRREGVVRHLARPREVPQRLLELDRLDRPAVDLRHVRDQVRPERGTALEALADGVVERLGRTLAAIRRRAEPAGILAEVEGHLARMPAERAGPHPHQLAAGAELVHPGLRVAPDPARQHVALPHLGGQRQALERDEHLAQAVHAGAARGRRVHALPRRQESGERPLLRWLDLAPV